MEGWPSCERCVVRTPSGAGPPAEGFFPRLETSASKSSKAALFSVRGGDFRLTSLIILLLGDINSPGLDVQCMKPAFGFFIPPFIFS